jgi:hypothetical protein
MPPCATPSPLPLIASAHHHICTRHQLHPSRSSLWYDSALQLSVMFAGPARFLAPGAEAEAPYPTTHVGDAASFQGLQPIAASGHAVFAAPKKQRQQQKANKVASASAAGGTADAETAGARSNSAIYKWRPYSFAARRVDGTSSAPDAARDVLNHSLMWRRVQRLQWPHLLQVWMSAVRCVCAVRL